MKDSELSRLLAPFRGMKAERDFSFARHTTIGCGGVASLALSPRSGGETARLLARLKEAHIPCCFLGAGANVLPSDLPFEGAVVRFSAMNALLAEGELLFAGAGVTGGALLRFALARGIGGFEFLAGIPTTVGGGITMNAGVEEGHFSDVVEKVFCAEGGALVCLDGRECAFSEKSSVFQGGLAVTGALLRGKRMPPETIAARITCFLRRRAHLPKGRSMGCVFVNPKGDSAGRIIEACGLMGRTVGGARVSSDHANFILNEGGSAGDVARLIALVKGEVLRRTGLVLKEEIRRLPPNDQT